MTKFETKTKMLFYFLKGTKRYFLLSILFAGIVSIFDSINPKIIQYTVDSIIDSKALDAPAWLLPYIDVAYFKSHLYMVAVVVIVLALIGAVCRYLFTLFDSMASEKLVQRMRNTVFEHLLFLPYDWYNKNHTGDIIQRCTSDVETIKVFVSEQLTQLFRVVLMIILSLYFMIGINLPLALIASAYIPVW